MSAIRVIGDRSYPRTVFDGDGFSLTNEIYVDISVILKAIRGDFNVAVIRRRTLVLIKTALAFIRLVAVDVLIRICFGISYASAAEVAVCDITIFRRGVFNVAVVIIRS